MQTFLPPPSFALKLTHLGRSLALTPTATKPGIDYLAARCVIELDRLRAPLKAHERERRRQEMLSGKQDEMAGQ